MTIENHQQVVPSKVTHKEYRLKVLPPELEEKRPVPPLLAAYMHDINKINEADILYWKQPADFDMFKLMLRDGTVFEVSGPLLAAYANAAGID